MDEQRDSSEEARLGPAGGGDDLQRLIEEMRRKGMSPGQIRMLSQSWEAACHDPMNKGRGGPSLPQNSPEGRVPLADPPEKKPLDEPPPPLDESAGVVELLERTAPWPVTDQDA